MHSDSVMDERTLREMYLTNFEIAIKEGKPGFVMTAYNRVNGVYANESRHLLGDILRGEWGFDWGGSNSIVEGVREGMNLEMPAAGDDSPCQLVKAVKNGTIDEKIVDERVDQLLDFVLAEHKSGESSFDAAKQHQAAEAAAEKCLVLLKNDEHLLPLKKDARVAVIGEFAARSRYQGAGSSMVNAERVESTMALLPGYFLKNVGYAQGFERQDKPNAELEAQAIALAKNAECVLMYIGLPESFETEGLDRTHMRLPQNQIDLLEKIHAVNPHVIVVLSAGSAVEMPWINCCAALVYGCLGGQAAAPAVLNVLSGKVNPGGKLAETFPVAYTDLPVSQYYPGTEYTAEYREGLYVGYRYTTTTKKEVRFPFGFGLSYTTFAYSDLTVTDKGAAFKLKNTGDCAGDEVVQLYISLPGGKVIRPARELKGFTRVHLEAGEEKAVTIPFDGYTFRYFNVTTNKFEVEGGAYDILIAASSEDIRLSGKFEVKGTGAADPYAAGNPARAKLLDCYRTCDVHAVPDTSFAALLGHPIPQKRWDRSQPLGMNDTIRQMAYAKNPICRMVAKLLGSMIAKAIAGGKPDLNLLFIYNIPFRGMGKMMGGMITMDMADDIRFIANGHLFRGIGRLVKHFLNRPKLTKAK